MQDFKPFLAGMAKDAIAKKERIAVLEKENAELRKKVEDLEKRLADLEDVTNSTACSATN
jgi:cell division protein FtsB